MKCKLFLAAACAVLFAGAASKAMAGDIIYDTSGPTVLLSGASGAVSVSYASYGANDISSDPASPNYAPSPVDVDYGTFAVSGANTSTGNLSSSPYTIALTVSAPAAAGGPIDGSILGTFYISGILNNVDTLQFTPNPGTYTHTFNKDGIGTVTWTFDATNIGQSGPPTYTGDMLGEVTYTTYTVPLPASVLGGSALIGLLALGKIRKNRQLV